MAPAIENARLYKELEESTLSTVRALVAGLEAKDPYLRGHAQRVTQYALEIARGMNLPESDMLVIERAGQLHDLGKMGISDQILSKPSSLTRDEYEVVKQHPVLGEQIIQPLRFLDDVRPAIRHHHERPDRSGYPDGLGSSETNLPAKIIAVADAFDAMTSPRPYRPAKETAEACREIASLRNVQFDPYAADLFCQRVIPLRQAEWERHEQQQAG
jgi:putative nucleotidyltransferase with HDIG domain